jgi:hypothetical protein
MNEVRITACLFLPSEAYGSRQGLLILLRTAVAFCKITPRRGLTGMTYPVTLGRHSAPVDLHRLAAINAPPPE